MGLFFKVADKELVEVRNKIFVEKGIPALTKNGFQKSPFSTSWFGKDDLKGYTYELCRVSNHPFLEMLTVHIIKGDCWIQIYLNVFQLSPPVKLVKELHNLDGIQFKLPPNSITEMRLRINDDNRMPLLRKLFGKEHKIKLYYSRSGFEKNVHELSVLIDEDLKNIDHFVSKWHKLHKPVITDCQGHIKIRGK